MSGASLSSIVDMAVAPMRTIVIITLTAVTIGIVAWVAVSPSRNARTRAESEHGIGLPISATNIQCRGGASRAFLDRGAATLFEMSADDLVGFVSRLRINSRSTPAKPSGDPTFNGYNVWPSGSPTFVPGDGQYGGWRRTWHGEAVPIEMLSCSSPKGDWLHVEV